MCAREDGKPKQPASLTNEFTYLVRRVKDLPKVRFHDLRHSHATQLLAAGVHPKIVQERLGHSTITVTMTSTPTSARPSNPTLRPGWTRRMAKCRKRYR
ncbi:MAG: tyrosine-type recombinase/integrase, partial [Pseudolabrys sp.]